MTMYYVARHASRVLLSLYSLVCFGYFLFFSSLSGAGKGRRSLRQSGRGNFSSEIQRGGGYLTRGGRVGAHRGWEGCRGEEGGRLNIIFQGRNVHQDSQEIH